MVDFPGGPKAFEICAKFCYGMTVTLNAYNRNFNLSPKTGGLKIYEHPNLMKIDKKKCGLMDVNKLSMDGCMHAAQNERLPLRLVVQVLFFEQARAAAGALNAPQNISIESSRSTANIEEWEKTVPEDCKTLEKQMSQVKIRDNEYQKNGMKKNKGTKNKGGVVLLPSRSRRFFDKLWIGVNGQCENRSSETSGCSQSPTSVNPGENRSSGSSRHRRYSVS